MDLGEAEVVLNELINNSMCLANGVNHLSQYIKTQGFTLALTLILTDENHSYKLKKFSFLILKYIVRQYWETDVLRSNEKVTIRQIILEKMNNPNYFIRTGLCKLAGMIGQKEFPRIQNIMEVLFENLESEERNSIDAALRIMIQLFKKCSENSYTYVPKLLPCLYNTFINGDYRLREKVLYVLYQSLRTFSWADGVNNRIVEQCLDETYAHCWLPLLVSILQSNPKAHFDVKKNALRVLTVFIRDFVNYTNSSLGMVLEPTWKLVTLHLPIYTEHFCYGEEMKFSKEELLTMNITIKDIEAQTERDLESEEDEEDQGIEGMTKQLLDLLACLLSKANIKSLLSQGLVPLISTISFYIILPIKEQQAYLTDYTYFVEPDEEDEIKSIRANSTKLLNDLIEYFGDIATEAILLVLEKHLKITSTETKSFLGFGINPLDKNNILDFIYENKKNRNTWKKREMCMFVLGKIADDLMVLNNRKQDGKFSLNTFLEPMFQSLKENPDLDCLKGRMLWSMAQLVDLIPIESMYFEYVLDLCYECIAPNRHLSLKLSACRTLIRFLIKFPGSKELTQNTLDHLHQVMNETHNLLRSIPSEIVHIPIEVILQISKADINSSTLSPEIIHTIIDLFGEYHNESLIGQELIELFKLWCSNQKSRVMFKPYFIKFICETVRGYHLLTKNGTAIDPSLLRETIEIYVILIKNITNDDCSDLFEVLLIFQELMLQNEDLPLLNYGTLCFRTFVATAPNYLLKMDFAPKLLEITKYILKPEIIEAAAQHLGYLIVNIFDKLVPDIDTSVLFSMVLKIYKARMPSTVQSLIILFARLIHRNPKEILRFLGETAHEGRISLKIVLDKWLLHSPLFRGRYTKRVTLSALGELLKQKDNQIESLMVIHYNPSHTNANAEVNAPLKILCTLLRGINTEHNAKSVKPKDVLEYSKQFLEGKGIMIGDIDNEGVDRVMSEGSDGDDELGVKDQYLNMQDDDDYDAQRLEVDLDVDDDDPSDERAGLEKFFNIKDTSQGGLLAQDTESQYYFSDMLAFDFEEYDDCEEVEEDDLIALNDPFANIANLEEYLIEFLNKVIEDDRDYFSTCLKYLLKDDQQLAKTYLNAK